MAYSDIVMKRDSDCFMRPCLRDGVLVVGFGAGEGEGDVVEMGAIVEEGEEEVSGGRGRWGREGGRGGGAGTGWFPCCGGLGEGGTFGTGYSVVE